MIAIVSKSGDVLKVLPWEEGKVVGYNKRFGFTSANTLKERGQRRQRHGMAVAPTDQTFEFQFQMTGKNALDWSLAENVNCKITRQGSVWEIQGQGPAQNYQVRQVQELDPVPVEFHSRTRDWSVASAMLVAIMIPMVILVLPKGQPALEAPVVIEQVTVQIKPEVQKAVEVSTALDRMPEIKRQAKETKRAITQNLGFLGLLGRKDLKKAVGGVPTQLKDVSAGAGPGGKEGSGGELLVGLGQGLKRTTVGNTGVAGLGGVGTKGAGGGAGGYGNSSIGSGEGKALSTVALSQELVLEGGLDRTVVQATIAKYLSQVRACYENGLQKNPGLAGQVTMNFEIGGGGDLNFARVERTSLDDKNVEACISQRMLGWKFPKPRGGVGVKVSYPFVLRSIRS